MSSEDFWKIDLLRDGHIGGLGDGSLVESNWSRVRVEFFIVLICIDLGLFDDDPCVFLFIIIFCDVFHVLIGI